MDVERTMEFILEQRAHMAAQQAAQQAQQAKHDLAMAEMRENQIQLQKFQLAQESAHAAYAQENVIMRQALAQAMYHLVENLDKTTKSVDKLSVRVDDFIRKTDERLARVERDVDGLQGRN